MNPDVSKFSQIFFKKWGTQYSAFKLFAYGTRDIDRVFWNVCALLLAYTSSGASANERCVVYCVS